MKKVIGLFTAVMLLNTFAYAEFNDIDSSHWGYEAVEKMAQVEILSGYPDGSFRPSKNITLAEYASIFSNFFGISESIADNYFVDISENHWAKGKIEAIRQYIQPQYSSVEESLNEYKKAYEYGIMADMPVTREIVMYSLNSILAFDTKSYVEGEEKLLFADYDKIIYPEVAVTLYKKGIISGEIENGKVYIAPERYISRAEISAIFYKLLNNGQKISNTETVEDFTKILEKLNSIFKNYELNQAKSFIYDTDNVLHDVDFNSILTQEIKELIKKYFNKLEYNIVDFGFYSYNKAYATIEKEEYDYSNILKPLNSITLDKLNTKDLLQISEDIVKLYKKEKLKVIKTVEKINFIKDNNEWKIIL